MVIPEGDIPDFQKDFLDAQPWLRLRSQILFLRAHPTPQLTIPRIPRIPRIPILLAAGISGPTFPFPKSLTPIPQICKSNSLPCNSPIPSPLLVPFSSHFPTPSTPGRVNSPFFFPLLLSPPCFCLPLLLAAGMLGGIPALPVALSSLSSRNVVPSTFFSCLSPEFQLSLESFPSERRFPPGVSFLSWNYLCTPSRLPHPQDNRSGMDFPAVFPYFDPPPSLSLTGIPHFSQLIIPSWNSTRLPDIPLI